MIVKTAITRGRLEYTTKRGRRVESFFPDMNGDDCEVFIQFDNGSVLGHTKYDNATKYMADAVREFEELPTSEQY